MAELAKKLWGKVPTMKRQPEGWLTVAEFSKRAGDMLPTRIYKGIESGKISRKNLAILDLPGRKTQILIDWDAAAYDFIAVARAGSRPEDFVLNDAREYKPFHTTPQQERAKQEEQELVDKIRDDVTGDSELNIGDLPEDQQRIVNQRLVTMKTPVPVPTDGTTAKYVKELLEIEKRQIELRKAANDVIDMATERAILANIAAELNGNASKSIPRWSTIFAAESNPRAIRQLMKKMYVEIFRPINGGDEDEN